MKAGVRKVAREAPGPLERLDGYKDAVVRLFPALPRVYVDGWAIIHLDALATARFLDHYQHRVTVLEIGTFLGVSAFHFSGHPKVSRVFGVDPNPKVADEINDKAHVTGMHLAPESLGELRVLDVARAALKEFEGQREKVDLLEGVVGTSQVGVRGEILDEIGKVEVPEPAPGTRLLAYVDGLHTEAGVRADLERIFGRNSRAVALLDDCRHPWGEAVKAGISGFMEGTSGKYRFRAFSELMPGLSTSSLGIVYAVEDAAEVERTLEDLAVSLGREPDLLWALRREEALFDKTIELDRSLSRSRDRLEKTRQGNERLRARNKRLSRTLARRSGRRRYELADAVVENALRLPGVGAWLRRRSER